jgi:hypothetical protein
MDMGNIAGKLNQEEIDALKKSKGLTHVHEMIVPDGEGEQLYAAYFSRPTIEQLDISLSMQDMKPMTAKAFILKSCFVGGDSRVIEDAGTLKNATTKVDDLVNIRLATLKKK